MNELRKQISTIRNQYDGDVIDEKHIYPAPVFQFETWMQDVMNKKVAEPNAMILATADKNGKPSVRTVLLRDFSDDGFVFYTNYNSKKGKEIDENPQASLLFYWPELQRQVRIDGTLVKINPLISEKYFKERPIGNQISAWISPQSSVVKNKLELENNYRDFEKKYKNKEIPYPVFWGGYVLKPLTFEFWQGQANRLHDRICYEFDESIENWKIVRLAP